MMVYRPTAAFAAAHPAHMVAFGFGAGLAPFAPGTFGTLLAWPVGWFFGAAYPPAVLFASIAFFFLIGVWACAVTGRHLGVSDHGGMVWDEFVAFLVVLAIIPHDFWWHLSAFVLFRAFDILKPAPIRWFERRWKGGFGVMFDDLLAAGYTLLVLALVKRAFL